MSHYNKAILLLTALFLCLAAAFPMIACSNKKEDTEQFYYKTLSLFDAANPGLGLDTGQKDEYLHYPMTYALYASAEAHRALINEDRQALENAVRAANWLVEHNDLDGDGQIGWGLPFAWDAGGDGSINPPHTEYAITTALVIQGLLDTWDALDKFGEQTTELQPLLLQNALDSFRTFQSKYDSTPEGLIFRYSTAPQDDFHVVNAHSMLIGQFQRLSTYPIAEDIKHQIENLTEQGFNYLRNHKREDSSGVIFWNYREDIAEDTTSRPNDSCHEMYTLQGIWDYQLYSQTESPLLQRNDVNDNIQRFLEGSWVREIPRGGVYPSSYQEILDRRARLWGIGYLLYLSARLDLNDSADTLYETLATQYMKQETLILRPDLEDMNFYPRFAAHALLGLSYYVW
jgi:hypothetical protein